MNTIYKYKLNFTFSSRYNYTLGQILLPEGAKLLCFNTQGSDICLWAEVDPKMPTEMHTFAVVPTGGDVPEAWDETWEYQATVFQGAYVWHIYKAE